MHAAVRPHAATGAALLAASAIAVSPMAPPLPDVQASVQHAMKSVAVELDAVSDPIASLTNLLLTSANNAAAVGTQLASDPAPILGQLISNQGANATVIGGALQGAISFYQSFLPTLPGQFQMIADQLKAGDISGAVNSTFQLPLGLALGLITVLPAFNQVAVNTAQNVANAVAAVLGPDGPVLALGLTAITPVFAATSAFGDQAQLTLDSAKAGDLAKAVGAALSIPTELTNAFLNGTGDAGDGVPGDVQSPGILTPGTNLGGFAPGLVASLLNLRDTVAQSLKPVGAASALAALAAPIEQATTVTLKSVVAPKALSTSTPTTAKDATDKDATAKDASTKDATAKDAGSKDGATTGDGGSTAPAKADKGGRHRAQSDNPVSSAVKKFRDSVKHASGESRHAKAGSTAAK